MNRTFSVALLLSALIFAMNASATTYYIAANGSDSNGGTTKISPWAHAPGMPNCISVCAATAIKAGDSVIFRGGDTWHFGTSTAPSVGGSWNWPSGASGSSTHCNYNGNDVSTCIYIGVDQTWFSGTSWTRPVLTGDNPPSSVLVSSCENDNTGTTFFNANKNSYLIFDNFEITGYCWSGTSSKAAVTTPGAQYTNFINLFVHGWSGVIGSSDVWAFDIFDGSDALNGTTSASNQCAAAVIGPPCRSGYVFGGESYDVHDSIFNNISNGMVTSQIYTFHDNILENAYNSYDGITHPNGAESNNGQPSGLQMYFYNNIFNNVMQGTGVGIWPEPVATTTIGMLFFNNVEYRMNPGNCYMYDKPYSGSPAVNVYFFNNTTDAPCRFNIYGGHIAPSGVAFFQNNHLIGYSSLSGFISNTSGGAVVTTDKGSETYQSEATANSQGYTASNFYAPTSNSGATVGAGANNTAFCTSILDSTVAAACQNGIANINYQIDMHTVIAKTPISRPTSGAWDSGAYQFSAVESGGPPNPPSGLSASVQ
jgi:hypothetical protein